jgi:hypothetical protein
MVGSFHPTRSARLLLAHRMNTDKTKPKNCFWLYPCSSAFIRGHLCFLANSIRGILLSAGFFTAFELNSMQRDWQ